MRRALAVVASSIASALLLAGCGGGRVALSDRISVTPHGGSLRLDPNRPRVRAAAAQLDAIAGHTIAFEIDVALLSEPPLSTRFDDAFAEALEDAARDLAREKERSPRAFAYGMPLVERVVFRYAASGTRSKVLSVDAATRTLTLTGRADGTLLPHGTMSDAIYRLYEQWFRERFANVEPEAVAVGERADYFAYVSTLRGDRAPLPNEPREPRKPAIDRVLRLERVVGGSDPALAVKIRHWLVDRMEDWDRAYELEGPAVRALPPSSPWHTLEAAWIAWLNRALPSMIEEELTTVGYRAFVRELGDSRGQRRFSTTAYPGFDPFAFGLFIADRWIAAGHPIESNKPASVVLCPLGREARCSTRTWYEYALDVEGGPKRVADALVARKDRAFTEVVFGNIGYAARLAVLRESERDAATWQIGAVTLAHHLHDIGTREAETSLLPEMHRVWDAYPDRRGVVLYVLAKTEGNADPDYVPDGVVGWTHFTERFRGGVARADFASFLEQDVDAVGVARWLMFARPHGKGASGNWAPMPMALPRLDRYLASAWEGKESGSDRVQRLRQMVHVLCSKEHDPSAMEALISYFKANAATHPGNAMNTFGTGFSAKECRR